MKNIEKWLLAAILVIAAVFFASGFFIGKAVYNKPFEEKVERDTVILHDTIPDYLPMPKDSATIKWVTKWLPSATKTDTITKWDYFVVHDSVAVEVPITSKHYGNEQYDAYISGFEPNLDSIFVYQKTEYVTETITRMKPPNKWELDVVGGIDYNTAKKSYEPYAMGELLYKPNRLQIGLQGGVIKADKVEPFIGGKVKIKVF